MANEHGPLTTAEINAATFREISRMFAAGTLPRGQTYSEGGFSAPSIRPEWVPTWLSDENDNL